MKNTRRKTSGIMFAAMTDLFMNFALALVWVLFVMPTTEEGEVAARRETTPREMTGGSAPADGLAVATVTIDGKTGALSIRYQGRDLTMEDLEATQTGAPPFPDHLVFRFRNFVEFERLAGLAVERDAAVSLKLDKP